MVPAILWTLTFKKNYYLRPLVVQRNSNFWPPEVLSTVKYRKNSNGYLSLVLLFELTSDESNVASFKKFQKNDQLQEHLMTTEWQYI